jgi:hypothetical protein
VVFAMFNINKNIEVILEQALDTFARNHPRKLQLEIIYNYFYMCS